MRRGSNLGVFTSLLFSDKTGQNTLTQNEGLFSSDKSISHREAGELIPVKLSILP
jgi:hypothetical protein